MFRSIWEEVFWNSYQFEADNLWLRNFWPNGSAASGIKNREKDTVLPNFVVSTHMNSSVIPMLQRRMLKISSMAAGEAGRKKSAASGVCFWKSFWNSHCSAVLLMSAAKYIWASIHTEHLPGYVWPKSRHLCLSRALLLGWIPWRQKPLLPSKGFLELGQRSGPQQGDTGGRRVCRADNVSRQAAPGSQSMGGTGLLGWGWSKEWGPLAQQ